MKLFSKDLKPKNDQDIRDIQITPDRRFNPRVWQQILSDRVYPNLSRAGLAFGGLVLVGGVSGANWGVTYVRAELVPKISQELSRAIKRPIQLGAVEQVTWSGVRLGRTVLPATATDADELEVEAIDIHFNPLDALNHRQLKLTLTLIKPTAYFDQDQAGGWIDLELKFDEDAPIEIEQIRLRDGTATLKPRRILPKDQPGSHKRPWDISDIPTQMTLRRVNGYFSLQEQGERLVFDMAAQPDQGKMRLQGDLQLNADQIQLALQTQALPIKAFAPFIPTSLKVQSGLLTTNIKLQAQPDRPPELSGTAELRDLAGWAKGEPNPLTGINGNFQFQGQDAILSQGKLRFGQIPFTLDGKINLQRGFDLNLQVASVDAAPFMQTLKLKTPFPVVGALKSDDLRLTGAFEQPVLSGTAQAAKPIKFDRLEIASVQGRFTLALADDHLWLHEIRLQPVIGGTITTRAEAWLEPDNAKIELEANLPADAIAKLYQLELPKQALGQLKAKTQVTLLHNQPSLTTEWSLTEGRYPAQGKIALQDDVLQLDQTRVQVGAGSLNAQAELKQGRWQASLSALQVPLSQVSDLPGQLQGQLDLTGDAKNFSLEAIQGSGQAVVQLHQGSIAANLNTAQGQWQAKVSGSQVPLQDFSKHLEGHLEGNVSLNGNLTQLNILGTRAEGTIQLSHGIPAFDRPINADLAWNGEQLQIKQAKAAGVEVDGLITPGWNGDRISGIANLDFNVNIQDYDLAKLPISKPLSSSINGLVNLKAKIAGAPDNLQVNSDVELDRFAIKDFEFEPLRGKILSQPDRQLRLDLKGNHDRIAVVLDPNYQPASFLVQLAEAKAEGRLIGDRLIAKLQNFALEKLKFAPANWGPIRGMLAGDVEVDLADLSQPRLVGTIDVLRPGIGPVNAKPHPDHKDDRFTGKVQYQDGVAALSQGTLRVGQSHYAVAAQATPKASEWRGQVATEQSNFQDLFTLLSPQALTDLIQKLTASNAQFNTRSNSQPDSQLQENPLPITLALPTLADLTTLTGRFSGKVILQGSPRGMAAQATLQGQDWQIADYGIHQLSIADAQFDGETLWLPAVSAAGFTVAMAGKPQQLDAQLGFAGQLSSDAITGRFQLDGIALPQVQTAFNLPIQLDGRINAVADLSGQPTQPNLTGELHLQGVNVRDMAIQEAKIGFSYIDRQFHLENWKSQE